MIEYETIEEKSYFEAFDKADFQSYLVCPFDSDEGKDLKWGWSTAQNYTMMNAKDIDVRPMHFDKVSAFWAFNAKFSEAFAGTPIYLKNTKEGKVYRLDEEGKQLGVWTDATIIADSPKDKCMINTKKIVLPTVLKEQKLHPSCCIQFDSQDGFSTVCSKEKIRCWEDVRRFGR